VEEQRLVKASVGGHVVQIEVREPADPEVDVKIGDVLSFDGVVDSIEAIAASIDGLLKRVSPKRATVELGFDVGVETGGLTALLVKGKGSATLTVTLEWERADGP
jgi:hypothetical protein